MSERESIILTRRFGIGTDQVEGFQDIAKDLDLSAERVRQLYNEGLVKLRRKLTEVPQIALQY